MPRPMVSGIAALLKSYDPTATVAEMKAAILNGGDVDPALAGVTITGRRVNAFGSLQYLIGHAKPVGAVESVTTSAVTGYAYDSSAGVNPISVRVSIDGVCRLRPWRIFRGRIWWAFFLRRITGFHSRCRRWRMENIPCRYLHWTSLTGAPALIGRGTVVQDTAPVGVCWNRKRTANCGLCG